MKKYVNGKYLEMTEEEIESMKANIPAEQPPSFEDRLAALEGAMLEQILGGAADG